MLIIAGLCSAIQVDESPLFEWYKLGDAIDTNSNFCVYSILLSSEKSINLILALSIRVCSRTVVANSSRITLHGTLFIVAQTAKVFEAIIPHASHPVIVVQEVSVVMTVTIIQGLSSDPAMREVRPQTRLKTRSINAMPWVKRPKTFLNQRREGPASYYI